MSLQNAFVMMLVKSKGRGYLMQSAVGKEFDYNVENRKSEFQTETGKI